MNGNGSYYAPYEFKSREEMENFALQYLDTDYAFAKVRGKMFIIAPNIKPFINYFDEIAGALFRDWFGYGVDYYEKENASSTLMEAFEKEFGVQFAAGSYEF